jgi:hypothetical protein
MNWRKSEETKSFLLFEFSTNSTGESLSLSLLDCNKHSYIISQVDGSIILTELGPLSRKENFPNQVQDEFNAKTDFPLFSASIQRHNIRIHEFL